MPPSPEYQPLAPDDLDSVPLRPPPRGMPLRRSVLTAVLICGAVTVAFYVGRRSAQHADGRPSPDDLSCLPFIPAIFAEAPPSALDSHIPRAASNFRDYLDAQFSARDIDCLSVAVTTSAGILFEGHWGSQRANESMVSDDPPTRFSQYRVASVSKLLLTYEAWILEQRGIISWDDPVSLYLPSFSPNYTSWTPFHDERIPITLRHLASHQSGLGHDWPAGSGSRFPVALHGLGPPPHNGKPFPSHEDVFSAIHHSPLVTPPGAIPSYSNTAFGVLGMALVAANRAHSGYTEPDSIAGLMDRDVFKPLDMVGTHYLVTDDNRDHVVVPSVGSEIIDMDFLDAMNPSGGMFTSLNDLSNMLRTLLRPGSGPLERATVDQWLRPLYSFAEDDWTELGMAWEIFKHSDSHGRRRRLFMKLGELYVLHAAVALHPGSNYGIIVLMSGRYRDATALAHAGFDIFQPAFDAALEVSASDLYGGVWSSFANETRASHAHIRVHRGTIWMDSFIVRGTEVLNRLFRARAVPLRSTGRRDEMRLDIGIPGQNGRKYRACMPHWTGFDNYGMQGGAAVNLIYFTGDGAERRLHVPSVGVTMRRLRHYY